jgi:metallo-beta-lactamase class B
VRAKLQIGLTSLTDVVVWSITSPAAPQQPTKEDLANNPPLFLELARKALKWDEPAEPVKIVGPIYSVGSKGLGVFLIRTTEGLILINTAMPGSGPLTEDAIRKLGFDPKDIKLLLVGHAHRDHAGATVYFKKKYGARIAMIVEEKDLFESGGNSTFSTASIRSSSLSRPP